MSKKWIGSGLLFCFMGAAGCGGRDAASDVHLEENVAALTSVDAGTTSRADVPLALVTLSRTHKVTFFEYSPGDVTIVEEGNLDTDPPVSTTRLDATRPTATLYKRLVPAGVVPTALVQADQRAAALVIDGGVGATATKDVTASTSLTTSGHATRDFSWPADDDWFLQNFCKLDENHHYCWVGRTGDVHVSAFGKNVQIFGFNSSLSGATSRFYVDACDFDTWYEPWVCDWHTHAVIDLPPRYYAHYWSGNQAKGRDAHIEPLVGTPREDFAYSWDEYQVQ